jgi:hypothetical protein
MRYTAYGKPVVEMLVSAAVRTLIGLLLIHLAGSSASAWDRPGHLVVDAIAWELMSETARTRAVELLRSAPADAELGSFVLQARELFVRSGYWPDVVRDEAFPARKEKYDRPTWHYVNHFWRDGDLLPEMGTNGDLIHQLGALRAAAPDPVALAWLMHLVGDVHQPLHSSARVTALEPQGDRGGNDFVLDDEESWGTLHGYWDGILSRARRNHDGESDDAWVARVSREIMILHPRASLDAELEVSLAASTVAAKAKLHTGRSSRSGLPFRRSASAISRQDIGSRMRSRCAGLPTPWA